MAQFWQSGETQHGLANYVQRFHQTDFGQILNVIMTAERAPLTAIETQRTALIQQGTAFTTLASRPGDLASAIETLTDEDGLSIHAVSSGSPDSVGATATSGGVAGLYKVVVSELARAQVMAASQVR